MSLHGNNRPARLRKRGIGILAALVAGLAAAFIISGSASGSPAASTTTTSTAVSQKPTIVTQPSVSGTSQQGQTLTANNGTWSGAQPITFSYQWQRCDPTGCHEIYAANKQTYTLTTDDVGKTMRVKVTGTNQSGSTLAITAQTSTVTAPKSRVPQNTSPPTISGLAKIGQTLTGSRGNWSNNPTDFNYFWMRCDSTGGSCSDISGAHAATYTSTSVDGGNTVRFKVQASNAAGSSFATSVPSAVISAAAPAPAPPAPVATGCPAGSGTINIDDLKSPARLLLDGQQTSPNVVVGGTRDLMIRYHVSACGRPVQGALVYSTAVPFNQLSIPPEQPTGADGWAELHFNMLRGFPVSPHQELIALFARARKPGENLLAGISTRRLFSVRVNLNL